MFWHVIVNCVVCLVALLSLLPVPCVSAESLADCDDESAVREFAEYLVTEREYYRAISEYMRFRFLCPDGDARGLVSFSICRCYYFGGQFSLSRDCFDNFFQKFHDMAGETREHAFYLRGRSALLMRDFDDARTWFGHLERQSVDEEKRFAAQMQIIWSLALQLRIQEAKELTSGLLLARVYPPWFEAFAEDMDQFERLPRFSPTVAALVSCVLPGAGHAYCGRYRDGMTAFIVNGLLVWGLSSAIRHHDRTDMVLFGAAELFFYNGTIVSAWSTAQKLNKRRNLAWLESVAGRFPLDSLDADWSHEWPER